tara:strand:- start:634 stop:858 length:225 start_codon:yes stop_codon:yes gene_type:complete
MKKAIWISDLTHTAQGIGANGFPLGASYIYTYAKKIFGNEFDFKLFKLPAHLEEELRTYLQLYLVFLTIVGIWN